MINILSSRFRTASWRVCLRVFLFIRASLRDQSQARLDRSWLKIGYLRPRLLPVDASTHSPSIMLDTILTKLLVPVVAAVMRMEAPMATPTAVATVVVVVVTAVAMEAAAAVTEAATEAAVVIACPTLARA